MLAVLVISLITTPALPLFTKAPAPPVAKTFAKPAVVASPVVAKKIVRVAHHTRVRKRSQPRVQVASARDVDRDAANLRMPRFIVIEDQQIVRVSLRSDGTFIIETVQPIRMDDLMPRIDKF